MTPLVPVPRSVERISLFCARAADPAPARAPTLTFAVVGRRCPGRAALEVSRWGDCEPRFAAHLQAGCPPIPNFSPEGSRRIFRQGARLSKKPLCAGAPTARTIGAGFVGARSGPGRLSKMSDDDNRRLNGPGRQQVRPSDRLDHALADVERKVLSFAIAESLHAPTEGISNGTRNNMHRVLNFST
jgi:hypothetical protein